MALNSSPRTWVSGETVTAAMMNAEIRDATTGIQAAWTSYAPVLTGSGSNPTGYTTTGSAFMRIGKTIHVRIVVTMAAATGSGNYALTLPVAAIGAETPFKGIITDTGTGWYNLHGRASGSALQLYTDPTTAGATLRLVTAVVPMTFAAADFINIAGTYEAA